MATRASRELPDPRSYVTFDDVFALALANTKTQRFVADSDKWQSVLYEVWQRFRDRIPELRSMFFDESRSPLAPQSDAFYQLINILSGSKLISLPNPSFEHICMGRAQKSRAERLERRLLQRYEEPIREIGQLLEEKLGVARICQPR